MKLTAKQLNQIGVAFVLEGLAPDSPYGIELRRTLAPDASEYDLLQLGKMMAAIESEPERFDAIRRALMLQREIRGSIKNVEQGTASDVDFFELKRFLLQLNTLAPLTSEYGVTPLPAALKILDPNDTAVATFSIESSRSWELEQIRNKKATASMDERAEIAAMEEREQRRIRAEICNELREHTDAIYCNYITLGRLDFLMAKARLALQTGAIVPQIGGDRIVLEGMTNPKVRATVEKHGGEFCPITIELDRGSTVITGANMGGKTVVLHTLAMNVYLAHCGLAVYAKKAIIPKINEIFLIHEQGEHGQGLSDFGMEMVQCKRALETAQRKGECLLLFDELARGTNPFEGAAIARATVRYCNELLSYALFATHFDDVAKESRAHYQIAGLKKSVSEVLGADEVWAHMDYTLKPSNGDDSIPHDAMTICRLIGLPDELIGQIEEQYR
ncbi:MAG: hypothetical protein PHT58_04160 [Eubacteriales bacterium]|nr:hypothetical protein [Eubacteriales bacterium]